MSIKHFEISNKVYLKDNFEEVISLILEHGSGVFDDAQFVPGSNTDHEPMSSYSQSQHEARLTLYKNENINFFFKYWLNNITGSSIANKRRILNLYHVDKTGTEIFTTDVDTRKIETQTMGYMQLGRNDEITGTFGKAGTGNMIDGITFINNNAIAIDFNNIHFYNDSNPQQAKFLQSKGIIIFALTNKNNVALITPSYVDRGNIYSYNSNGNDIPQGYNYLKVLCRSSYYSKLKYDNIPWKPVYGGKTILNPIIVNNSDEYVPDVYYTPVTQYIIDPHDDAILDINGDLYYYNGFIAVKVNS